MSETKGFNNRWEFKEELINLLEQDFHKKNTSRTTLRKVREFFNDNSDNIKCADSKELWPSDWSNLNRKARCFEIIKSGYFKPHNINFIIKLKDISEIGGYDDGTFRIMNSKGKQTKINERDYLDLKLIFE